MKIKILSPGIIQITKSICNLCPDEIRQITYEECKICENVEECRSTSVTQCRRIIYEASLKESEVK